jgi:hypothetical protein
LAALLTSIEVAFAGPVGFRRHAAGLAGRCREKPAKNNGKYRTAQLSRHKILSLYDKTGSHSTPAPPRRQGLFLGQVGSDIGYQAEPIEPEPALWQTLQRMYVDHVPVRTVLLLLALVALLFFVQVPQGSYQAMHGPTSTQKDIMGGTLLQLLIGVCVYAWCICSQVRHVCLRATDREESGALLRRDPPLSSFLRC